MHYFLFPWATEGSLRDFWKKQKNPNTSQSFVRDMLDQVHGLADALEALHNYVGKQASFPQDADPETSYNVSGGIRHGDLKPENILIFRTSKQSREFKIGTLKIADMGLAKYHEVNTRLRSNPTSTKYGTRRYEPPEVDTQKLSQKLSHNLPTSRLYDTWSMGCILLETIVWLLHGLQYLDQFNDSIREDNRTESEPPYYKLTTSASGQRVAKLHPLVVECIRKLSQKTECEIGRTALGDLLAIVRDSLLVIDLPSSDETREEEAGSLTITPAPTPHGE